VVLSSTSSSSDSSGTECVMASPPPFNELGIAAGLEDIPEAMEVETAHETVDSVETVPHTDTSAGMFGVFCNVVLLILPSLTLVAQVLIVAVMPMLAFVKWSRDNHRHELWMEMKGRSSTARTCKAVSFHFCSF
jgi:hypothetical protein